MRLGMESRGKVIAAAVMAVLAIVLFVRMILPSSPGAPAPAAARPQPQGARRPASGKGTTAPVTASLDPTLRLDLLQASENTSYAGSGRNIFRAYEPPPPVQPKDRNKQAESCILLHPGCPGYVPPPPPIPLKFFGFANRPGEAQKVFLVDGDSVFVGKEGDIVNRRYKILKISSNSVEVEDVLNNNRQVLFLAQGPGT